MIPLAGSGLCSRCGAALGSDRCLPGLCPGCLLALGLSTELADDPGLAFLSEEPIRSIGSYRLLEPLGEGGMAVVYLAEQKTPLRRLVAIKVLKEGFESRQVLARFDLERQALASLHHPAIAQVYDAGSSTDGRPYFVMEYVPGRPLTEYCDERRLGISQRLELFAIICDAVDHAHRHGIVHRDLKPANILVGDEDGRCVPKVIDFGLAKATRHNLTEYFAFTRHAALMGTPEYMSPEQADPFRRDIDHRADVYALGVVLYELLVGITPFESARLRARGGVDMMRTLLEEDPPSLRWQLTRAGKRGAEVAARRATTPGALVRLLRRELQWIVAKALEKEPARRYSDAAAFRSDVERFLRGEPTVAGRPGLGYRIRKFAIRHRAGLSAGAALAFAIAFGVATSRFLVDGGPGRTGGGAPERQVNVRAVTSSGDASLPILSPDGRYVVFSQFPNGWSTTPTFWIADQTRWGWDRLPLPVPVPEAYLMTWSKDGRYIYFRVMTGSGTPTHSVYRYSLAQQRTERIRQRSFCRWLSPDEQRLACVREDRPTGRSLLVIEDLHAERERIIAARPSADPYNDNVAWLPDGRTLSVTVGRYGYPARLVTIDVANGRERLLNGDAWKAIGAQAWLPDGRAVLVVGEQVGAGVDDSLYRIDAATGAARRVETGLKSISGWQISLSAEGRTLAGTNSWFSGKLFVLPDGDSRRAHEIGPIFADRPAFLPDSTLLFTGDDRRTWAVNPDGSGKRRTTDIETVHVTASRNGEVIVGAQWHQGLRLGRLAGSEFTLLDERQPAWHNDVSPDGRWVAYITMDTELWKVPTAGGPATKLLGSWVFRLRFTRDGRSVVVLFKQPDRPWEIGVVPLDGGGLAHRQAVPADTDVIGGLRPTDDGTAVDLVRRHAGVTNIWRVPLAAGEPVQLTHFVEQARIHGFDWSHDGRLLAVVRGGWRGDIVLLRGEW